MSNYSLNWLYHLSSHSKALILANTVCKNEIRRSRWRTFRTSLSNISTPEAAHLDLHGESLCTEMVLRWIDRLFYCLQSVVTLQVQTFPEIGHRTTWNKWCGDENRRHERLLARGIKDGIETNFICLQCDTTEPWMPNGFVQSYQHGSHWSCHTSKLSRFLIHSVFRLLFLGLT
jgi:hypothetical protein